MIELLIAVWMIGCSYVMMLPTEQEVEQVRKARFGMKMAVVVVILTWPISFPILFLADFIYDLVRA